MNLKEIEEVMGKKGLDATFGENFEAEHDWLIRALGHAMTVIGTMQEHLGNLQKELDEMASW